MMANPQESPTSVFRFENAAAGQQITGFSVPLLDTSDNGFPPNEGNWAGTSFTPPGPNEAPTANDDNRTVDYDFDEADADGIIGIRNVLNNDTDPDGDRLSVVSSGGDTTPNNVGWFDWIDASNGGQIRVNVDGRSQFRGGEAFENLPQGQSVTTSIEYTVSDRDGATSTATISLTMQGTADVPVDPTPNGIVDGENTGEVMNPEYDDSNAPTDNDVLDLRGAGVVQVAATDDATDAGALTGTITFKDDTTLDFSQIETILQDEPALTIAPGPNTPIDPDTGLPVTQENGAPVELIVTRNTPTDQPLVVTIQNGDPSELDPPLTVTIPAGSDSVSFLVDPVDDPLVDGDQIAPITATAPGLVPATQEVLVEDDDVFTPTITVTTPGAALDAEGRPILTEGGDPVDFVITRDGPLDQPLVLQLTSGDETEASVPQFVTILLGQTSVTVPVTPVDDDLIDGDQFPTITLTPFGSDIAPVSVETVVQDNDAQQDLAPVAGDDNANTQVNTMVLIDVLENDVDPDGDDANLLVTDVSIVSGGGFAQIVNNQVLYIPQAGFIGSVELAYEVTDEQGLTDTATVNLHVTSKNTAPDAVNDLGIVGTNALDNGFADELGNVLLNDSDPDGDTFVFAALGNDNTPDAEGFFGWVDGSNGGEFRVNQNGSFEFRDLDGDFASLLPDELAITSVEYTIADAFGAEDTATISVKVIGEYDDCGCGGGLPTPPDFFY